MTIVARAPAPAGSATTATVSLRGFVKRFGPLVAVDHVDLDVAPGVHALIGQNGAGKSTLVKALYGFDPPDEGSVLINGEHVRIPTPRAARELGLGMVFQQSTLIPAFSVSENIALYRRDLPRTVRWARFGAEVRTLSERYGLDVDPKARAGDLSVPEQQRVEIVRLLLTGARILIFDEPTSTLPAQEVDRLFATFERLRTEGYTVLFITHKLSEVRRVADRVTIMRDGAVVGAMDRAEVTEDRLVELMFHEATRTFVAHERTARAAGGPVLELSHVSTRGERHLDDVDLCIREGELVGVAGISGEGQRELGDVAIGMLAPARGRRLVDGKDATRWSVRRIRDHRVAYIPENVSEGGVIWSMTLAENVALANLDQVTRDGVLIDWPMVRGELGASIAALGVELPSSDRRAMTLSGGNLQRFVVARELARDPAVLVACYPTRGLDARTTDVVRGLLMAARDRGTGVLLISQDLQELAALSDRILVLRGGRIVAERAPGEADAYELGRLMMGDERAGAER